MYKGNIIPSINSVKPQKFTINNYSILKIIQDNILKYRDALGNFRVKNQTERENCKISTCLAKSPHRTLNEGSQRVRL